MTKAGVPVRTALLAGATGLVGRALLSVLLASKHYRNVHILLSPHAAGHQGQYKSKDSLAVSEAAFRRVDHRATLFAVGRSSRLRTTAAQRRTMGGTVARVGGLNPAEGGAADPLTPWLLRCWGHS